MRPIAITLTLTLLVGVAGVAAPGQPTPSEPGRSADRPNRSETARAKLELAYSKRLIDVENTAEGYAELARWCEKNGLDERAGMHWRDVLLRDLDHTEARQKLGYVRRGDGWGRASEAAAEVFDGDGAPARETTPQKRRAELAARIRDIWRRMLIPSDPEKWARGQVALVSIRDPAAARPMVEILGDEIEPIRKTVVEALSGMPGNTPTSFLMGFALSDRSKKVRSAAVEALRDRLDEKIVRQFIVALARGRQRTMEYAAEALGRFRVPEAIPVLIDRLVTIDYEKVYERELRMPPPIRGGFISFIADVRPVVGPGVVAYDPVIGYITPGGIRIPEYERPVEVLVPKIRAKTVKQPAVLEALRTITNRDFGYDQNEWVAWYSVKLDEADAAAEE